MPHDPSDSVLFTLRQGLLWARMEQGAWRDTPDQTDYARAWHAKLPQYITMLEAVLAHVEATGEDIGDAVITLGYQDLWLELNEVSQALYGS